MQSKISSRRIRNVLVQSTVRAANANKYCSNIVLVFLATELKSSVKKKKDYHTQMCQLVSLVGSNKNFLIIWTLKNMFGVTVLS